MLHRSPRADLNHCWSFPWLLKLEMSLHQPRPTVQVSGIGGAWFSISDGLFFANEFSPGVLKLDPWLEPFKDALRRRFSFVESWVKTINESEGGLEKFSRVSYPVDDRSINDYSVSSQQSISYD